MSGGGSHSRLVLFDIDGTLLRCGSITRELFGAALDAAAIPRTGLTGYDFAGKIDPAIVQELCVAAGWSPEEGWRAVPRVQAAWLQLLERHLEDDHIEIFPGVREMLDRLARERRVEVGLLTGNWRDSAMIKLRRAGLEGYFPFGAFGDDGRQRRDLPPVARRRASAAYRPEDVWVVGDTIHDVDCARAHGLRCLAVGTGGAPAAALRAAGAEAVVATLTEVATGWPFENHDPEA